MTAPFSEATADIVPTSPAAAIRARAVGDVRLLRRLERTARLDGLPHAELRATNARAAARRVLDHARRVSSLYTIESREDRSSEMAG